MDGITTRNTPSPLLDSNTINDIPIPDLQHCLKSIASDFLVEKEVMRRTNAVLSREFNVFDYLVDSRSEKGELMLSQVLSMILDTKGAHGQGKTFQSIFIAHVKNGIDRPPTHTPGSLTNCSDSEYDVTIEHGIGYSGNDPASGGRIDLLLTNSDNWQLAIENKPFATDQYKQIERYLDYLKSNNPKGYGVIYLTGDGSTPASHSIDSNRLKQEISEGHLCIMGYKEHFVPFLQECSNACQSPRFTIFLDDFINYVNRRFHSIQRN